MRKNILIAICFAFALSSCTLNRAKIDQGLQKYFDAHHVDGCFTMLDNADGKITVYNMLLDTQRFAPASTFNIVSSLIGLETGLITDENMVIPWDGVRRRSDWDRSIKMTDAFKMDHVPYFQEVVRRIGKDTIKMFIDSIEYGNKDISVPVDSFWFNNKLKISPDEQLLLLKKLYFDQLPFRKGVQESLRTLMLQEDNTAYKLSYKTGLTADKKNNNMGWVCGWIEENKHVYFFVTFVRTPDATIDMKNVGMSITRDVLKGYGFFEGKK